MDGPKSLVQPVYATFHEKKSVNPVEKRHRWQWETLWAFDSRGYALVFEGADRDGVVGSKWTHMGGYVEQRLAQSTNGWLIEEEDANKREKRWLNA